MNIHKSSYHITSIYLKMPDCLFFNRRLMFLKSQCKFTTYTPSIAFGSESGENTNKSFHADGKGWGKARHRLCYIHRGQLLRERPGGRTWPRIWRIVHWHLHSTKLTEAMVPRSVIFLVPPLFAFATTILASMVMKFMSTETASHFFSSGESRLQGRRASTA